MRKILTTFIVATVGILATQLPAQDSVPPAPTSVESETDLEKDDAIKMYRHLAQVMVLRDSATTFKAESEKRLEDIVQRIQSVTLAYNNDLVALRKKYDKESTCALDNNMKWVCQPASPTVQQGEGVGDGK